jgi:hypothetical protein
MGDVGGWLLLGISLAWTSYLFALSRGARLDRMRDATDARQARWLFGGVGVAGGVALVALGGDVPLRVSGLLMCAAGLTAIRTARRLAPFDRTTRVPQEELQRAASSFIFDSRPPIRGRLEVGAKRRWTVFAALCLVGFGALCALASWEVAHSAHLEPWARALFVLGFIGLFGLLILAPCAWWVQRALRGIPMTTISEFGLVLGRDPARDVAIRWDEIAELEVRAISGSGISDRVILIHARDDAWIDRQPWIWRLARPLTTLGFDADFGISTTSLAIPFDELLARIRAFRPDAFGGHAQGPGPSVTT